MRKLYTPKETAALRRCSEKTLERERTAGTGCPYVLIGRRVFYREEDLETFLAERVRSSTSEAILAKRTVRPALSESRERIHHSDVGLATERRLKAAENTQ